MANDCIPAMKYLVKSSNDNSKLHPFSGQTSKLYEKNQPVKVHMFEYINC